MALVWASSEALCCVHEQDTFYLRDANPKWRSSWIFQESGDIFLSAAYFIIKVQKFLVRRASITHNTVPSKCMAESFTSTSCIIFSSLQLASVRAKDLYNLMNFQLKFFAKEWLSKNRNGWHLFYLLNIQYMSFQQCGMSVQLPAHTSNLIRAFACRLKILRLWIYWLNPFGVSKLNKRLHMLVWACTCQNATLLEITCRGSYYNTTNYPDLIVTNSMENSIGLIRVDHRAS